ncbi:MAG: fatty acid desaturase [Acidimicrobiia bacterium]|nr:fatty acid desaturase [Acidimicrobiia bacterium]
MTNDSAVDPPGGGLLRNPADRLTVAVVVAVGAARALLVGIDHNVSAWLVLASVVVMPTVWTIKHNVIHATVFTSPSLDRAFSAVLTTLTGTSSATTALVHNAIHHRHNNSPDDWTSVARAYRFRWRLLRLVTYPVAVIGGLAGPKKRYLADRVALRRRITGDTALVAATIAAALAVAPGRTLAYVVVPMVFGQWFLIAMNYLQHDGCDHTSALDHANNHTGVVLNRLLFNVGYHTAHHLRPDAHWSELPALHRDRVAPGIDPRLLRRSFWAHLVVDYALRVDRR